MFYNRNECKQDHRKCRRLEGLPTIQQRSYPKTSDILAQFIDNCKTCACQEEMFGPHNRSISPHRGLLLVGVNSLNMCLGSIEETQPMCKDGPRMLNDSKQFEVAPKLMARWGREFLLHTDNHEQGEVGTHCLRDRTGSRVPRLFQLLQDGHASKHIQHPAPQKRNEQELSLEVQSSTS